MVGPTPDHSHPVRTCVGCRHSRAVTDLVRCRLDADGHVVVGAQAGSTPGRGAWVCARSLQCFEMAVSRAAFARAWRRPVSAHALAGLREVFGQPDSDMRESAVAGITRPTAATKG